jgi:hypothetical protein
MPRKKNAMVPAWSPSVDQHASQLFTEKLASSGLTLEDAQKLSMQCLTAPQTQALSPQFKKLCSLKINYLDPTGKPCPDLPGAEPYFRLRYLEVGTGFEAQAEKSLRYEQPAGTIPVVYYPSNFEGWPQLLERYSEDLIITEGELKAAKACKEGFPTIGLGGVTSWKAKRKGIEFLPTLEIIRWTRRKVFICFDSDYHENPQVCAALQELAEALGRRGAFVHVISLPTIPGLKKVGLDDFFVHADGDGDSQFTTLMKVAPQLGHCQMLFDLSKKYIYVQDPGLIINQSTFAKTSPAAFTGHLESTQEYQHVTLNKDGEVIYKQMSASTAWLAWPLRNEVARITYAPGAERYVLEADARLFNIWPGWGCEPREGKATMFFKLIDHLFTGAEPEAKAWFIKWLAAPLQRPGLKLFTSVLIHGLKEGTGKSLVGVTMQKIYGKNYTEIKQADLYGGFNEWAEGKQFVLADDITGTNKRQEADLLKKMITQTEMRVNVKYVPSYTIPDCLNYLFTSNQPDALFLGDNDRRNFVHEVLVDPMPHQWYLDYIEWLNDKGAGEIFYQLMQVDLKGWSHAAPALRTAAKDRMTQDVRSDLGAWVRDLLATPDAVTKVGEIVVSKDLFTNKELLQFYDPEQRTGTTAGGLGRELGRAGVKQVLGGKPVRLPSGEQARLYIIRNADKWVNQEGSKSIIEHLTTWDQVKTKKRKY